MDPDLFKQRLEEFAELKQMKVPRAAGRAEATEPEVIKREGKTFTIELHDNPTIGWGIKKVKPRSAVCEDCCDVVVDRCVEIKKYDFPTTNWRKHCKACGMVQNPYTKKFDVNVKQSQHVYSCWVENKPEPCYLVPQNQQVNEEKSSHLKAVFKKPTK